MCYVSAGPVFTEYVMKAVAALLMLSACCFAQTAKSSEIGTIGGFLDVCGHEVTQLSKEQMDAMAKAPTGEFLHTIDKAMGANVADHAVCFAYLKGLIDGWEEGHEHGVLAMQFPAGIPDKEHLAVALKSMTAKDLQAAHAAMNADTLCLPDQVTNGEVMDAVLRYARGYTRDNVLLRLIPTSRVFADALRQSFPCPASDPRRPSQQK